MPRALRLRRLLVVLAVFPFLAPAAAGSPPSVQELQVNRQFDGPFPTNKQNEPSLAQNPRNPLNLIAGSNDEIGEPACQSAAPFSCPFTPGISLSGFYASFDGGQTWPCQGLIDLSSFGDYAFGDPGQAFDRRGNAYYSTLAMPAGSTGEQDQNQQSDVFVARSTDGGCRYGVVAKLNRPLAGAFNDKPAIAADAGARSPFRNNVYVAWTQSRGAAGDRILFARSLDSGRTWTTPIPISPDFGSRPRASREGTAIGVAPDGSVYVAWLERSEDGISERLSFSRDGGRTFRVRDLRVTAVSDDPLVALPGSSFREERAFPSLRVDASGTVYLAWARHRNGHASVILASSTHRGLKWSRPAVAADVPGRSAFSVSLAVEPRGALGLAFVAVDDRPVQTQLGPGVVTYDAYVARSTNGGASFTPPLRVSTVSSDPDASSSNSLQAQFIGDYISAVADSRGGRLYVVWTDTRNASACADVDSFRVDGKSAPDVLTACPLTFGNTDVFLGTISY